MKRVIVILLGTMLVTSVFAQVTVKKDVNAYYSMLPSVPASLQDAYQKCNCKGAGCSADTLVAGLKRNMNSDEKSMQTLTATEKNTLDKGTTLGNQMQADHVQQMNDDQKLEYAKNNSQLNGGNPDAMAWAQKMKNDPAEKAKFQAMTPDQKMAYMQQNGLMKQSNAASQWSMGTQDSGKATDALRLQKQMQARETGDSGKKMVQAWNDQSDMTKINADHEKLDQEETAELNKLPQVGEGGPPELLAKPIRKRYLKKHLELAQTEMQNMEKAYQDLYNFYLNGEAAYCNALKTINYGYTGDPNQDHEVSQLSLGQVEVMSNISNLADYIKSIYEFGARWQLRSTEK